MPNFCDRDCINYVYEKDTGMGWCRVDEESETCQVITRQDVEDQKADMKYHDLADNGLI